MHGKKVSGVVGSHCGIAALHKLENLVHHPALIHTAVPGVGNQLVGLPNLGLVRGIYRIAQAVQGHAEGIPGVVDEHHIAFVLIAEHHIPAGDGFIHHGGVIDDA